MLKQVCLFFITVCCTSNTITAQKPNVDSLLRIVEKLQEDTGTVIAYRMLAGATYSTNSAKAILYGKKGVALGKKIGFDKGVAGCLLNISVAFGASGKLDSSIIYIDTAIIWSNKVGDPARISLAYLNRADFNRQLSNMKQALKDCDTAMLYAQKANKDDIRARIYQTIASVYHAQDNWIQSKLFYERAYQLYEKGGNKIMVAISMNNLGNVFKRLKQYDTAISSFQKAIQLSQELGDQNNVSMYYGNLSDVYFEKGNMQLAELNALRSLQLAKQQENEVRVIYSQESLATIYLKIGKIREAINSSIEAYTLSAKNEMTSERQSAADILAEAHYKVGNFKEAYKFAQISKELLDSISHEKFDNEVAMMQTRFKVAEKDKEIELLAKDKLLQQQKLQRQRILIIFSIAIALLALTGVFLLMSRNKLKQRMKELELRNQIAADLHDEVGSSLSSIHMLSQMATQQQDNDTKQKDILVRMSTNAKDTMDKMGDIVWMIKPGESEGNNLKQRMQRFAYEISSSRNIETIIHIDELEKVKLTIAQRKNLYLIFKEALNNAVKYSDTDKMDITISLFNKQLTMLVKDYGKGFDAEITTNGNGLDNMKNRARELNGQLDIKSGIGKGTTVQLIIPV